MPTFVLSSKQEQSSVISPRVDEVIKFDIQFKPATLNEQRIESNIKSDLKSKIEIKSKLDSKIDQKVEQKLNQKINQKVE